MLVAEQVSHTQGQPCGKEKGKSSCPLSICAHSLSPGLSTRRQGLPPAQQSEKKVVQAIRENIPLFPSLETLYGALPFNTKYLSMTNEHMIKACSPHYSSEKYKLKPLTAHPLEELKLKRQNVQCWRGCGTANWCSCFGKLFGSNY